MWNSGVKKQYHAKTVHKMRKQIFRQGVQKFRRQAGACQGIYVRNGGKYASILCAEPSGVLCAVLLQNKKVLKVSLRPSGRVNHAVPPEFRAFALHLTESSNSFFCNGKNPSASTRSLWKLLLRRDDHTGLPAALSPPAALFEEDAVAEHDEQNNSDERRSRSKHLRNAQIDTRQQQTVCAQTFNEEARHAVPDDV